MTEVFGVQKISIYGSFGEFTVGGPGKALRAKYLLTKIRPGADGTWDTQLASHMLPWREVFSVDKLSFDELLQRDLDDSRVAHSLIPYLLGDEGMVARFFPPILAVITPRSENKTGIDDYYPSESPSDHFGSLFDFEQLVFDKQLSPLGKISYNPQKCAFIIADGQHRAMAVLALHRQLTKDWKGSPYASYYSHIEINAEDVRHLELPVCMVYFPELTESNAELALRGLTLPKVCRELFIVVNRSAKLVSRSRELLLDDNDLGARLMRRTLSALKNRGAAGEALSHVNSFSYGDADSDTGKQVVSGVLEYCSAVALYKMHSVIAFGRPEAFHLDKSVDVSSLVNARNAERPVFVLIGTKCTERKRISKTAGSNIPPVELTAILDHLGDLSDSILLPLFDRFRPFAIHNESVLQLRTRLSDDTMKADPIQNKCFNLIFEGSGVRSVFQEHVERMQEISDEFKEEKKEIPKHIVRQLDFCQAVVKSLDEHERAFQRRRACLMFGIDCDAFYEDDKNLPSDKAFLEARARMLYTAVSTQAFQIGFVMAVCNAVQAIENCISDATVFMQYSQRIAITRAIVGAYISGLNRFFSPDNETVRRSLNGLVKAERIQVFESSPSSSGLRQLHSMSNGELNERQWPFFRYSVLEIVHSSLCWPIVEASLMAEEVGIEVYRSALGAIGTSIVGFREEYFESAVSHALKDPAFESEMAECKGQVLGQGGTPEDIERELEKKRHSKTKEVLSLARKYVKSSVGSCEDLQVMAARLGFAVTSDDGDGGGDAQSDP